jgi:hypothetical protein
MLWIYIIGTFVSILLGYSLGHIFPFKEPKHMDKEDKAIKEIQDIINSKFIKNGKQKKER